ncbi:DUF4189 domain-containing protein [Hyphomicrobium sp. NDB2Meth4]|uniref:DUF4189 domain-containing protein n=1 Tax=Hyphomicrobium sp. NDB2Meth4 TaxID=1892846 RepID=UPI0009311420|nr:DUF4189 domain-containing protein [Hyphomicrobium sp. NDB2Meth4]
MLIVRDIPVVLLTILAAVLFPLPGFGVDPAVAQQPDAQELSVGPAAPTEQRPVYGAIAFTPDGSFFSVWKISSRLEAEEKVREECATLGRGACEAVSFRGEICTAIATGEIRKRRKITYAGGGLSPDGAEQLALKRCNSDRRARGTCQLRTTVCGDGRLEAASRTN